MPTPQRLGTGIYSQQGLQPPAGMPGTTAGPDRGYTGVPSAPQEELRAADGRVTFHVSAVGSQCSFPMSPPLRPGSLSLSPPGLSRSSVPGFPIKACLAHGDSGLGPASGSQLGRLRGRDTPQGPPSG